MSHVKELSVIKDFDMFGNGNFSVSFMKFSTKWKVVFPIMLVDLDFSGQCPLDIHFYLKIIQNVKQLSSGINQDD